MATKGPSDGREAGDPSETTPKEHRSFVDGRGAYLKTSTHLSDVDVQITGSSVPDSNKPVVRVGLDGRDTIRDVGLSVGMSPDQARELAEELSRQAEFAEKYVEYKRDQETIDDS